MNQALVKLVDKWKSDGSAQQLGFDWSKSRKNWVNAFPEERDFINLLPSTLDRNDLRSACSSSINSTREKFLTVMIWGYGDRGYGPYRVTTMLDQSHALTALTNVYELSSKGMPKEAYEYLSKNRIKTLGPSYSSKFINFCTPREVGAPIYDLYLSLWIESFAAEEFSDVSISSARWNVKTYSRYWDWVQEHSLALGCYSDEIELVIFRDAESKFSKSSGWSGK